MTTVATEMQNLLVAASLIAVAVAKELSPAKDELTARQAYAQYGKPWVEEQKRKGLLTTRRKGTAKNSPVLYSKLEIEALLEAERTMVRRAQEFIATK
jgi:hypothetical protein